MFCEGFQSVSKQMVKHLMRQSQHENEKQKNVLNFFGVVAGDPFFYFVIFNHLYIIEYKKAI
tara:strand:+ start:647 stop:832 length:186 start_codon:yes stop_codon:yes gene_type:complete